MRKHNYPVVISGLCGGAALVILMIIASIIIGKDVAEKQSYVMDISSLSLPEDGTSDAKEDRIFGDDYIIEEYSFNIPEDGTGDEGYQPFEDDVVYINDVVPNKDSTTNWLGLGEFTPMSKAEVLDYFGISGDLNDIISDHSLQEIPTSHGFHSTLAGDLLPYDAFIYHGEANEMSVVISFRDQTVPEYKLSEPTEKVLQSSTIDGLPVMFCGWQEKNLQAYRCEFEFESVLCSVETRNMSLNEAVEIVRTLLTKIDRIW